MNLTCNGEPIELETARELGLELVLEPVTIADLLVVRLDDPRPHGIAVAVNHEVVPRDEWSRWRLEEDDVVEVVTAVQGG